MPETLPSGYGVLVTRPKDQAGELIDEIRARGGRPIPFPTIEIVARDAADLAAAAAALPPADVTIFISRNAVQHGLDHGTGRLAAIGPATAEEIRRRGRTADIVPDAGFDSESLLAHPAFADIRGRRVRIVRGNAGRELLAATLRRRGARVDYLQAYQRRLPGDPAHSSRELAGLWPAVRAVVIMSSESLENLARLLPPGCRPLPSGPLLVTPAARVLKELRQRFPGCPAVLAAGPRASDLVDCIAARSETSATTPRQPD